MTAAGGFLGGLIGRRLPATPRTQGGLPIIQPPITSTGISLMDTMTSGLLGKGSTVADSSSLPQPSTPTTLPQMISPTSMLPRGISSYSLASLGGAVTPVMSKKQILRQIDDSIINFPSVSQSPTIPNQANRSPNSINFPKVNASPTHHIQFPVRKNSRKNRSKTSQQVTSSSTHLIPGEPHLLDAQIDTAMVVDQDDLDGMEMIQDDGLGVHVGVDSAITNTSNAATTQWSNSMMPPQVTTSTQSTIVASGFSTSGSQLQPRELPNVPLDVPLPNIPLTLRSGQQMANPNLTQQLTQQVYMMPETQSAISMSGGQIPMNLQNPNYLNQRILPSTAVYKANRNLPQQSFIEEDLNQWC